MGLPRKIGDILKHIIPSEDDWKNYNDDLDTAYAYKMFAGKSNDDMQKEFKNNVFERTSELRFMPIKPFQYYIFGLKQYIDTQDFDIDDKSDAASIFISIVLGKAKKEPEFIKPIFNELLPTLEYIAANQDFFEADIDIYGSFTKKLTLIKKRLVLNN